ncbi:MAG: flavin reductase family protein [Bacteroidales bacterium]|nr:flavin reductase family protein [Bacteroidales bacterium]
MKNFKPEAWLLPQPVMIIGTYDADGTPNAMNAAWGGQWDGREIMISLGSHATTDNLNRCGEFTVAFATADTVVAADYVGIVSGRKVPDKIARTGWQAVKAETVNAPLFTCFPMTLECRIKEKLYESETGCYVIAEIVNIACDEAYIAADGKPDVERMGLIAFEPVHHNYIALGQAVAKAFSAGTALK